MYKEHFRLTAAPFSIAPDPRFLYMSGRHREALAHLLYGVRGEGGFVLLTGEIGTGKTTLCRCLLEQIHRQCDVAFILNPKMGVGELLATICQEFHIEVAPAAGGVKQFVDAINSHLLRANAVGRRAVLIVDEAQNLQPQVLELLRLLTNLETNTRKLLQIILIGQPELQDMLAAPEMRQVAQRIVARFHLTHLGKDEVAAYVRHRLRVSGTQQPLIPDRLSGGLYRLTGGVPRLINLVCDRALLGAYVEGRRQATRRNLRQAAREVFGAPPRRQLWPRLAFLAAAGGLAAAIYLAPFSWAGGAARAAAVPMPAAAAPVAPPPSPAAAVIPPAHKSPGDALVITAGLDWPEAVAARTQSERLAFRGLFRRYGIDYGPDGAPPCKAAAAAGMRCLAARGGLADLQRFDQPAVLALDGRGGRYYALLTGLDGQSATFDLAGELRRVALPAVAQAWSGDYVLFWKPPAGLRDALPPGSRGPAVAWLRQSLAAATGDPVAGPPIFDADLARRVRAFQLSEGLVPDGVVGALTLAHLNQRLDKSLPRLSLNGNSADVLHP